ncbi:MAG TPA: kelch repeat-containing protein, partial [Blastocatellia bacterium]|nr:kelch repeat-containing protein [Blastocatellia bacterium]
QIEAVAPGIFTANASGRGTPAGLLLRVLPNGQLVYEEITRFNPATNAMEPVTIEPKTAGEQLFLILFLTGARGAADGSRGNDAGETVHLLLGGEEIVPTFVGPQGIFLGLDQMNVKIPPSLFGRGVVDAVVNYSTLAVSNTVQIRLGGTPPTDFAVSSLSQEPLLAGQEFVINGAGFPSNPAEIEINISGDNEPSYPVRQFTVTPTQIKAILPFNATPGYVRVKIRQRELVSSARLKVRTSVSGQITDNETNQPIPGVMVRMNELSTMTNREGRYLLADAPPGLRQTMVIDPTGGPLPYSTVLISARVFPERDNVIQPNPLQKPSSTGLPFGGNAGFLADEDSADAVAQPNPRAIQTDGITFEVAGNTTATFAGGGNSGTVFLTKIDNSRPPVRLPAGVFSSSIAQLSPFGVKLSPGGKLSFPNADTLPANAKPKLYRLDQTLGSRTLGEFVVIGEATVSADGKMVETAANAVLETSIFFAAIPRPLTRVLGKVVDSDGTTPIRQAAVRCRGQEVFTDSTGLFVLLDVPVKDAADLLTIEASYQRPNGRVDRVTRSGVVPVPNGVTRVAPDLKLPSPVTDPNRPPTLLLPASLTVTEGTTLDTGFIAGDPDAGQTITVTVSSVPATTFASIGLSGSAYTLRLAPGAGTAGNYMLTVRAADNGSPSLSATQTVALTILSSPPSWTPLSPTGTSPRSRTAMGYAYDETNDRLILFSGEVLGVTLPKLNDVWILANATAANGTPTWIQLSPSGTLPPGRLFSTAVYDPTSNRLIVHGGCPANCGSALSDTWVLTNANGLGGQPSWSQLPSAPVGRAGHTAVYDTTSNRMIIFAGQRGSFGSSRNDVWVLKDANGLGTPVWEQLAPSGNFPAVRESPAAVYDKATNHMIVFGGTLSASSSAITNYNDAWVLTNANGLSGMPQWIQLSPSGTLPAPRSGHSAVYDSAGNRLLIFGGRTVPNSGPDPTFNDIWVLTAANGVGGQPQWGKRTLSGVAPAPRLMNAVGYAPANGRMMIVMGHNNNLNPVFLGDVWMLPQAF